MKHYFDSTIGFILGFIIGGLSLLTLGFVGGGLTIAYLIDESDKRKKPIEFTQKINVPKKAGSSDTDSQTEKGL